MNQKFSLHILLVDDDSNIRRTLTLSLQDLGCQVIQASSVEEAIKQIRSDRFDLVLTDFKMIGETGLDLIKQAKAIRPKLDIVVMTAFASFENAVSVVKEGATDYLPKPFTNAQLIQLLNKITETKPVCTLEEMEKTLISKVLSIEPNQERAAEILGITKVTLWRKRKQYDLP